MIIMFLSGVGNFNMLKVMLNEYKMLDAPLIEIKC